MKTVIIIPARFESVRFPGKPLVELDCGMGVKKSLIHLTWEAAKKVRYVNEIFVATDDHRISDAVNEFGGKTIMTSKSCKNGTERCAEAVEKISIKPDIVINFQGDAPLTPPWFIEALIETMKADENADMATPVLQLDPTTYAHFCEDRRHNRVGGTTVVFDHKNHALYFSKEVIPFIKEAKTQSGSCVSAWSRKSKESILHSTKDSMPRFVRSAARGKSVVIS